MSSCRSLAVRRVVCASAGATPRLASSLARFLRHLLRFFLCLECTFLYSGGLDRPELVFFLRRQRANSDRVSRKPPRETRGLRPSWLYSRSA